MPDSIANNHQANASTAAAQQAAVPSDSAAPAHVYYAPQYSDGFPQPEAGDTTIQSVTTWPLMAAPDGAEPGTPLDTPLRDTGTMTMMIAALFLAVLSYRTGYKYIEALARNLFSTRRRENAFNDRTVNEFQTLTTLTVNTCVMLGLVIYYAIDSYVPALSASLHSKVFLHTGLFAAIAMVFYLLQLLVYNVVGTVFSDNIATRLWCDGFKAAHTLLGILLIPVVGVMLVAPNLCKVMLILAAILYICCRIAFIFKGFRIFFNKLPSLVYFILYLCSVEIVPLVLLGAGTIYICKAFL